MVFFWDWKLVSMLTRRPDPRQSALFIDSSPKSPTHTQHAVSLPDFTGVSGVSCIRGGGAEGLKMQPSSPYKCANSPPKSRRGSDQCLSKLATETGKVCSYRLLMGYLANLVSNMMKYIKPTLCLYKCSYRRYWITISFAIFTTTRTLSCDCQLD